MQTKAIYRGMRNINCALLNNDCWKCLKRLMYFEEFLNVSNTCNTSTSLRKILIRKYKTLVKVQCTIILFAVLVLVRSPIGTLDPKTSTKRAWRSFRYIASFFADWIERNIFYRNDDGSPSRVEGKISMKNETKNYFSQLFQWHGVVWFKKNSIDFNSVSIFNIDVLYWMDLV